MGFFDSDTETKVPKEYRAALALLTQRATEAAPDFPQRQTAGVDALTELAQRLTQGYMTEQPSAAYQTALSEATKTATTPVDVANMPEYQALVEQISSYGQQEANRLQRGNILSGNASWTSSAGRDVLGRSVTETQQRLMAAAVPFLTAAREQKQQAVTQLQSLESQRQGTLLNQIDAGTRVGEILRGIESAKLEAEYLNQLDPITFRYQTQPQLASAVFGTPITATSQASDFEKLVGGVQGGTSLATLLAGL